MGTSSSGDLGSSPRWKKAGDELQDLAKSILDEIGSIRLRSGQSGGKGAGVGGTVGRASEPSSAPTPREDPRAAPLEHARPVTVRPGPMREFGKRLIKAHQSDPRFLPLLEDGAIKVALDELLVLSTAATLKYRTAGEAGKLFKDYGVDTEKSVGLGLSKALDERFKEHLVEQSKEITDNAEKVRLAMGSTLVEFLDDEANPDVVLKMSANEVYTALHKTDSMEIARRFYRNYLFNALRFLISSNRSGISPVAEKEILHQLRTTYCDEFASELVKRARKKGWRPGEIPEKVEEWRDLLFEEEEAHAQTKD